MRLFDTHSHISLEQFAEDRDDVISRMLEAGVERALVVADSTEDVAFAAKMCEDNDFLWFACGVHPHNAEKYSDDIEKITVEYSKHPKFVCLGEIGLDYHYDLSPRDIQKEVFIRQLFLAHDLNKPVQMHIREAHGDTMDILKSVKASGKLPRGIMHCFTGSWECAKVYLDMGFYISLSGALTFKNAPKLTEVCEKIPLDKLLIETDCPYMAPVPLRGKRNEPSFIVHTAEKAAEIRGMSPEDFANATYRNALTAFEIRA